ncbi:HUS1 checkpoint protein [Geosmithia morbida]|uniref:Checkpoint protein n=1 Tax=Geosmithia morbida TaxID=1094350 RepID=A0A9P4YQP4_9HYPO|nr:HUS1 checkpoint protein [Geosmithia morbida]KAF4120807.1 HUS1 checkpoint protein [Geosmithia morbida]
MRFRTELKNIRTFLKLTAALSSLEKIAWMRLSDDTARFTVIPDMGSQVWASLSMDFIFDNYHIQSAEESNTINLELPLQPLQRALKSALNSISASLRLTKKDGLPVLSMTITATTGGGRASRGAGGGPVSASRDDDDQFADDPFTDEAMLLDHSHLETSLRREHEKVITQDIPVRVLHPETVETIMQPKVREPDVHIQLPPLLQLKAISDRFTRLALASSEPAGTGTGTANGSSSASAVAAIRAPKLEISANMHGGLRLRIRTETTDISSQWSGLENPELDPAQLDMPVDEHPSTRFREEGPDRWATVRVDGKDWSRVLSVGRLEGRVIACFAHDHALILYVYVPHYDDVSADDSVVTVSITSSFHFHSNPAFHLSQLCCVPCLPFFWQYYVQSYSS